MKNVLFIIRKEFRQIFRNPSIVRTILVMPIIQLIVIPFAADYEIKFVNLSVVDQDHSSYSQRLVQKLTSAKYFRLVEYTHDYRKALETVQNASADLILTIPKDFEKTLVRDSKSTLHLAANAVNGVKAGLGNSYASRIIGDFNNEIREEWIQMPRHSELPIVEISSQNRYNPQSYYPLFMVPGILVLLVTMIGALMSALNIVSEKEKGTIEQINVTPIKKHEFILGKLIPFWILGLVTLSIGFVVAYVVFGIVSAGSYLTIYAYAGIYLLAVLGVGLLLSTFVDTQQQATLFSFFMMMMFVLLGGLYTAIESMPMWAQKVSFMLPTSHFIKVIRSIVLKGSSMTDLASEFLIMIVFAVVINGLAVLNYRKRAA
jgi:ABC-2 type transport system permease protein